MPAACALALATLAACAPPQHRPPPVPAPTSASSEVASGARPRPPAITVAVLDPSGSGNWAGTLELSPAPASLVASCLEPGAAGWISVGVATHRAEASTTSLVEASGDTSAEARACILGALRAVHIAEDPMRLLLYVTFSPE